MNYTASKVETLGLNQAQKQFVFDVLARLENLEYEIRSLKEDRERVRSVINDFYRDIRRLEDSVKALTAAVGVS